ncbi:S8 family serine peptidase [Dryocola clanedunensis]
MDAIPGFYIEMKILKGRFAAMSPVLHALLDGGAVKQKTINVDSFAEHHSIHNYEYYQIHSVKDKVKAADICQKVEALDDVVFCSVVPDVKNLAAPAIEQKENVVIRDVAEIPTPDFTSQQNYLAAPKGMNILPLWEKGYAGQAVNIRHLDFGIYHNHEDFQSGNIIVVASRDESEDCNHGTASTGCIAASANGFGVTGIAHSSLYYFYDTDYLDNIMEHAQPGEIVSLNIQTITDDGYLPIIAIKSWWDTIKNITEKGAIVIASAGNGGLDLSNTAICPDYGDCGAILVDACNPDNGRRMWYSNYGHYTSMINSWGESVTTAGYSSLQDMPGHNRDYTDSFNGTSSATPLCCGALALLQSYARKQRLTITPQAMRELIAQSDYLEGLIDHIGRRPNVEQLTRIIDKAIQASLA